MFIYLYTFTRLLDDLTYLSISMFLCLSLSISLSGLCVDLPNSPVLFAVDEYNTWEAPSAFHYKMRAVGGKEICVPNSLNFLGIKKAESEAYTMKNGICIGAASSRYPNGLKIQYEDTKSSIPLTIRVPVYSQVEIASCVSYYQQQNVIDGGMNTLDVITYRMQSGYVN